MRLISDIEAERRIGGVSNPANQVPYLYSNVINIWKPDSETYFLRHGGKHLAMMTILPSALLVHDEVKRKFVEGARKKSIRIKPAGPGIGKIYVLASTTALSGMLTFLFHNNYVIPDILTKQSCDACVQTRSMGNQMLSGVLIPMLMSSAGIHFVAAHNGYEPQLSSVKDMFKYLINSFQRNKRVLAIGAPLSVAASYLVTSMTQNEWRFIVNEVRKFDESEVTDVKDST